MNHFRFSGRLIFKIFDNATKIIISNWIRFQRNEFLFVKTSGDDYKIYFILKNAKDQKFQNTFVSLKIQEVCKGVVEFKNKMASLIFSLQFLNNSKKIDNGFSQFHLGR